MSQAAVESFLGRIITDPCFNRQPSNSMEIACRNAGLLLSDDELLYLKRINFVQFTNLPKSLDGSIKRG